jgi:two-component system NtrC family sensor kinase
VAFESTSELYSVFLLAGEVLVNLRTSIGVLLASAVFVPAAIGVIALQRQTGADPVDGRDVELTRVTARLLDRDLSSTERSFALGAELFDLASLPAEETTGVLRMLYKQDRNLTVVALLDSADQAVVEPVFLRQEQIDSDPRKATRLPVDESDLGRFLGHLPINSARESGRAFSGVYADRRRNVVLMAGAMLIPAGADRKPYLLVFERSLRGVQQTVAASAQASEISAAFVIDGGGRLVVHPDGNRALGRESMLGHPLVDRLLAGERTGRACFDLLEKDEEVPLCGAFEHLDFQDWALVVQRSRLLSPAALLPAWSLIAWVLVAFAVAAGGFWVWRSIGRRFTAEEQLRSRYRHRAEELNRVQASLLENRKLTAVGDLGAGVAHEFNNPLGGILGLTQLMLRRKKDGDPDLQFLKRIEEEAKRCKSITDNLLRFSESQGSEHREPTRVDHALLQALDLIDSRLDKKRITINRDLPTDLPLVMGNEGELQRAFLSVLHNAETAMPDGGQLGLSIQVDGDWLEVRVSDTGRGITSENLERIFEPFFTTKDNWTGAGLGLYVVYQIVQDHSGGISVESEEGVGTTVTFRLPLMQAGAQSLTSPVPLA